jgi:predicted metal-dependent phosphoesterase TrpH
MKIDLHIHSKDGSDGKMTLSEIFMEAHKRKIEVLSITDHDSIECQEKAIRLAAQYCIHYITGVELNISFSHPRYRNSKPVSLDMLGYEYDIHNNALVEKLSEVREYRKSRAERILENLNRELKKENLEAFTQRDMNAIEETVEGAFGRPHIANYMVKKGIVKSRQEAFDKYLARCNVPKMPVSLQEASQLIRDAGGVLVHAHPNDPHGTSLVSLTPSIREQHEIIKDSMLPWLDGVECWHSRHDPETVSAYRAFAEREGLMVTGGSDCHQQPVIMGTLDIPSIVAEQFDLRMAGD